LAFIELRPRFCQGFIDDGAKICLGLPPGDFPFVDVDRVADRLLHAVEIESPVSGDLFGHLADKTFRHVAGTRFVFRIGPDKKIENPRKIFTDMNARPPN
jgi:hypothetical protein